MLTKTPNPKCRTVGCPANEKSHGLCEGCHRSATRLIAAGLTTWAELERMGLARTTERRGRGSIGHFLAAFLLAKQAESTRLAGVSMRPRQTLRSRRRK